MVGSCDEEAPRVSSAVVTFAVAAASLNSLFYLKCRTEGKLDSVLVSLALVRLETHIHDTINLRWLLRKTLAAGALSRLRHLKIAP